MCVCFKLEYIKLSEKSWRIIKGIADATVHGGRNKYHDQQMQRWIVHDMVRVAVNC
jgi:hypothetical protein